MTPAFALLPPVIIQTVQRVPLDPWSAAGFAGIVFAAGYLAYRRSPLIATALAFSIPFAAYRDVGQTTITMEKCVALGTAAGLLLGGAPAWPASRGARNLMLAGGLVLAAIAVSSIGAAYPVHAAREFFKQAEYLVLLWCAATLVERVAGAPAYLVGGVAASAAVVSTLAVSQAVVGGAPSGVWVNGHALPRVTGTLEGPNQLAGYLEAVLPQLWVWPLLAAGFAGARGYVTFVCAAALVLSQSRAGIVVTALGFVVFWLWRRSQARSALWPMIAGAVLGLAVTVVWFVGYAHASWADLWNMFLLDIPGQQGGGVGTRSQLWPAAIALFLKHPIAGCGAGNFELLLPTVGVRGVQTQAASLPLQTLAEQGILGLIALVAFVVVAFRESMRLAGEWALAAAACLALCMLVTHQLVDDLFFFPKVAGLGFVLLGAGCARPAGAQA